MQADAVCRGCWIGGFRATVRLKSFSAALAEKIQTCGRAAGIKYTSIYCLLLPKKRKTGFHWNSSYGLSAIGPVFRMV